MAMEVGCLRRLPETMKIKFRISWFVFACLCLPILSRAQSREPIDDVVSVRELSIPRKAHRAFEQGIERSLKNDTAGSLPHFQRAVAEFATYYEAYYMIGEADLKLWRIADAEQAFRASINLSGGKYAPAQFGVAAILDYQKKFAEAERVTRIGLDLDSISWYGHYYLGLALFGLDRLEEAEKSAREALRLKTDSAETEILLIDIHSREKNYRALLKDLDEYLKLDPDSPNGVRARALQESAQRVLAQTESTFVLVEPQP